MGNEQSVEGQAVPETGLRLSTLCRYQAEAGNEEGLGFSWFQASTDVSGLVLRGAHRWGYVVSHVGGQRLFKDTRRRFFVLLDHYMCYFDSHAPETRMRGSIDLDKALCHLELLPRPLDRADVLGSSSRSSSALRSQAEEGEEHRVEMTRKTDGFSMVLCFSSSSALQDWMKSIFDVQQRMATFSPLPLRHSNSGRAKENEANWVEVALPESPPTHGGGQGNHNRRRSADDADDEDVLGPLSTGRLQRRRRRRRGRRRGTLESSPPVAPSSSSYRGHVPLSWADGIAEGEDRSAPTASVWLGKASERLAGLPRGGRAECGEDGTGRGLDEYGAFTTAHASVYEGWTRGLQPHGWGRMVFANGDRVEGWWEHGVLEGSGEHASQEEGWTYRGGYVTGERHGPGRLVTAQGDVWECEWRHGVVASGVSGTHATLGGEVYQGGCAPSAEDAGVPCRAGHGRLRRRNGEQVETQFRAGRAFDGAKGVVRFRNGAIFFGELREARPHG